MSRARAGARAASGWTVSLRTSLALVVVAAVAYAAGIAVYLAGRVAPAAASLHRGAEPVLYLSGELQARAQLLGGAVEDAHRLMASHGDDRSREAIASIPGVVVAGPRARAGSFAAVPADLREALARADGDISLLHSALAEILALDELRRYSDARPRLGVLDSLRGSLDRHLADAQRYGLRDLVARERELNAASTHAVRAVLLWVVLGALLLPVVLVLVLQRLERPLGALESALRRVSDGDLAARVRVWRADEVGRLAVHFNQMTRVLHDRAEAQGRFAAVGELLAGVAHEVSNPLMAITAQIERRLAEPGLSVARRVELLRIQRQARRAGRPLSRVLRFARPADGRVTDLDLRDVVLEALDLVAHQCEANEIVVDNRIAAAMPRVRGDAARLEQVFVNLLVNAIHAVQDATGPRRITLTSAVSESRVDITVADSGSGVPSEIAEVLFKPFTTSKGDRGTGLGLYLSRQIVRAYGGVLEWRSAPGEGAQFAVGLPKAPAASVPGARPEAATPARPAARAEEPLAGLRVLVADDEEAIRANIAGYLRGLGATAIEAEDGPGVLETLRNATVDVILLDLKMPRLDWVDLFATLWKSHPELADRVIVLSGDPGLVAEVGSFVLPPERIFVKPVDLAALEDRILVTALSGPP